MKMKVCENEEMKVSDEGVRYFHTYGKLWLWVERQEPLLAILYIMY